MSDGTCCAGSSQWQGLYVVIEGRRHQVEPAAGHGPTSALFRARCAYCSIEYTGPFRLLREPTGRSAA